MESQHDLGRQFDEINLQDLGDKREAPGSAEVTLDHLNRVFLGQELDVERSGDIQGTGYSPRDLLYPPDGLDVKLLRRELYRRVTGVHSGIFNVLGDGVSDHLSPVGNGIELDFLGSLVEFADHDRVLLRDLGGQGQEMPELLLVVAHIHRGT